MAKISVSNPSWTPTAVADTTNFTDSGHLTVQGGSSTQVNKIEDVQMGGQAASAAPSIMVLARDSTVGITLSGGRQAALDPATAALAAPPVGFTIATTKPQRSSTLHLLQLAFNAFGGMVRWFAGPDEQVVLLGNAASFGEVSLSAYTGGTPGLMSAHVILEPK